jgi:hypothetical protein
MNLTEVEEDIRNIRNDGDWNCEFQRHYFEGQFDEDAVLNKVNVDKVYNQRWKSGFEN